MGDAIFTRCVTAPSILPIGKGGTGAASKQEARTNLEIMKATTLYENQSGTQGTITISKSVGDFEYVDILFRNDVDFFAVQRVYNPNGKIASLYVDTAYDNTAMMYLGAILLSGISVTWSDAHKGFFAVSLNNNTHRFDYNLVLWITKIIGYQY